MLRTHTCGEIKLKDKGQKVTLCGFVKSRRDHGGLIFLDLRDRYGVTQTTYSPKNKTTFEIANKVKPESVVKIKGEVIARPKEMANPKLETGEIEVEVSEIEILSESKTTPFELEKADEVDEETRLKYRYIDLRRSKMQENLRFRQEVINYIRTYLMARDFIEVQTPLLSSSSPEGARDFLVPSRMHPGKFYALPQAPQQYKQLLMIGGLDRYFQIAPCMRDEDARADRSPGEFYQLDLEMSYVTKEDIFNLLEPLLTELTEKFSKKKVMKKPFPRYTFKEVLEKYGTDKPDIRFGLELTDITELAHQSDFQVFKTGERVKGIKVTGGAKYSRKQIDDLIDLAKKVGARGLAWVKIKNGLFESQIAKFFSENLQKKIVKEFQAKEKDFICFISDEKEKVNKILAEIRSGLASNENLKDDNVLAYLFVEDFPMYQKNEETGKIDFSHNPFSMPRGGMKALQNKDPYEIIAEQYDIVCNGTELSSGAIRNNNPKLLEKAFQIAGYSKETFWNDFGNFATAFEYGAPPHGGIAPGIERLLMILLGEKNIREVMAFPKNQKAQDLVLNAPEYVSNKQLEELNIKLNIKKKK